MAFYHETFGNIDVAPTSVLGNHELACGRPARQGGSVLTLAEAVNGRRFKGNDRLVVRETLAALAAATAVVEPPLDEDDTQEAPRFKDDEDSENTATTR